MKYEYVPRGYNSWYQYQKAMRRRKKVVDAIVTVFTLILLVGAFSLVGYMELS